MTRAFCLTLLTALLGCGGLKPVDPAKAKPFQVPAGEMRGPEVVGSMQNGETVTVAYILFSPEGLPFLRANQEVNDPITRAVVTMRDGLYMVRICSDYDTPGTASFRKREPSPMGAGDIPVLVEQPLRDWWGCWGV